MTAMGHGEKPMMPRKMFACSFYLLSRIFFPLPRRSVKPEKRVNTTC
uniref:Uncharacterized protein n=1 Tax=Rhizophora mucronata TaxID=61149 RepID=A0A2P2P807_RHIMU